MAKQAQQKSTRALVMAAVFIATFMTSVEVTIVTTALPTIISKLHGLAFQSWIMSAYLLTTAVTTPIYGKLADVLGRKRIFQWGVLIFTLGSGLSGLAPHIGVLILARALQGIGAGAVMPLTFTIIADYYSYEERAKVLALNNTAWGLSALIGPLLGGFLVDTLSWHWVFFVNVPLGLIVLVLIWIGYREPKRAQVKLQIDLRGIFWLAMLLVSLLLAVQQLDHKPIVTLMLLIIALIGGIGLWHCEHQVAAPLIDPKMFQNKTFTVQIGTAMLLSGALIAYQTYSPIWLQSLYHLPATNAGLAVSSSSIMWLLASFFVGYLLAHYVPKYMVLLIVSILTVVYAGLLFSTLHFPVALFYVIAALNGTGMGLVVSMNTILSQHLVPTNMIGSATAMFTLGRSLGQTLLAGIYGAVLNLALNLNRGSIPFSQLNKAISAEHVQHLAHQAAINLILLQGLHAVFAVVVVLLLLVLLLNLWDPNRHVIK